MKVKRRPSKLKTYLYEKQKFLEDPWFSDDPLIAGHFALGRIKLNLAVERQAEIDEVPAGVFWIYEEVTA